ncbi:hypothetical protein BBJ28_00009135 [Nothophytophthora sp. Chile5]|nr:hypothetical protein BBJ28_00009135 [Nothophytophthora sp. Chile5]
MHNHARLLRLALKRVVPASASLQQRGLHASADEDEEIAKWFEEMQKKNPSKAQFQADDDEDDTLPSTMEMEDDDEDDEEEMEPDQEAEEFLDEAEELFSLAPAQFQKRMATYDKRHAHLPDDEDEEEDDEGIERATERIPKKKLVKMLGDFNPNKEPTGKNAERMPLPSTWLAVTANQAPLEKKPKRGNPERVSYRQESVGVAVLEFVQNIFLEDADASGTDIVPTFVEVRPRAASGAYGSYSTLKPLVLVWLLCCLHLRFQASVAPDLRRIVLYWEPVRLNSENQVIGKKKLEAVKNRLERQERWVRRHCACVSTARILTLVCPHDLSRIRVVQYAPIVQFKQRKEPKVEKSRELFEDEMRWLDKV